ncbi:ABC transporter permease [Psychrobacillus sp. Sa2BUA9]|uniref:ABC transporter permease n=1 Tax=Psychrobacillus faecigallinarum TaxID=2762235 RepID=A0ABR8R6V3_9BACI|nr:ABC transporter permease [Psychrobacillus faecigallinarum]MBD7943267.1 ABC transporter permease [Psychrobacillus faecigallinarum]
MISILQSEWFKFRHSKIMFIIFTVPIIGIFLGLTSRFSNEDMEINEWYLSLLSMNLSYALLFLPLITGVLASAICRYEHQAGGWKQLLALPVTRGRVFTAKYLLLMLLVLVVQILFFAALYIVGMVKGFTDPFPMGIVWKCLVGGWVATLPLVALQLWMSILFKSFAAPFAVNVILTLPTILVVNSERLGSFYPWAQPFLMMYIGGETGDTFFVPWDQLLTVVGGSFILFFVGGYLYFQRKAI